jgi:hypothetical protein
MCVGKEGGGRAFYYIYNGKRPYYKAVREGGNGGHVLRETTSRGRCELVCPSLSHFLHTGPVRPICVIWPIFPCVFSCVCLLLRYLSQMFSLFLCLMGVALYLGRNLAEIESHSLETSRNRRIFFGFPVTLSVRCLCPFVKRLVSWTNFSRGP